MRNRPEVGPVEEIAEETMLVAGVDSTVVTYLAHIVGKAA